MATRRTRMTAVAMAMIRRVWRTVKSCLIFCMSLLPICEIPFASKKELMGAPTKFGKRRRFACSPEVVPGGLPIGRYLPFYTRIFCFIGNLIQKVDPSSFLLEALRTPLWCPTIFLQIANPIPVPAYSLRP